MSMRAISYAPSTIWLVKVLSRPWYQMDSPPLVENVSSRRSTYPARAAGERVGTSTASGTVVGAGGSLDEALDRYCMVYTALRPPSADRSESSPTGQAPWGRKVAIAWPRTSIVANHSNSAPFEALTTAARGSWAGFPSAIQARNPLASEDASASSPICSAIRYCWL